MVQDQVNQGREEAERELILFLFRESWGQSDVMLGAKLTLPSLPSSLPARLSVGHFTDLPIKPRKVRPCSKSYMSHIGSSPSPGIVATFSRTHAADSPFTVSQPSTNMVPRLPPAHPLPPVSLGTLPRVLLLPQWMPADTPWLQLSRGLSISPCSKLGVLGIPCPYD